MTALTLSLGPLVACTAVFCPAMLADFDLRGGFLGLPLGVAVVSTALAGHLVRGRWRPGNPVFQAGFVVLSAGGCWLVYLLASYEHWSWKPYYDLAAWPAEAALPGVAAAVVQRGRRRSPDQEMDSATGFGGVSSVQSWLLAAVAAQRQIGPAAIGLSCVAGGWAFLTWRSPGLDAALRRAGVAVMALPAALTTASFIAGHHSPWVGPRTSDISVVARELAAAGLPDTAVRGPRGRIWRMALAAIRSQPAPVTSVAEQLRVVEADPSEIPPGQLPGWRWLPLTGGRMALVSRLRAWVGATPGNVLLDGQPFNATLDDGGLGVFPNLHWAPHSLPLAEGSRITIDLPIETTSDSSARVLDVLSSHWKIESITGLESSIAEDKLQAHLKASAHATGSVRLSRPVGVEELELFETLPEEAESPGLDAILFPPRGRSGR
jgi:hypothetical protein